MKVLIGDRSYAATLAGLIQALEAQGHEIAFVEDSPSVTLEEFELIIGSPRRYEAVAPRLNPRQTAPFWANNWRRYRK